MVLEIMDIMREKYRWTHSGFIQIFNNTTMDYEFRKAVSGDQNEIWAILQQGIKRRKKQGSTQWQDGYPNLEVINNDIDRGAGFVLTFQNIIVGYVAILINDEPEYSKIKGSWLTNEDFLVFHRVAISEDFIGRGLSKKILEYVEEIALTNSIFSIKADTNQDNTAMLKVFERMNYVYCGKVYFRGSERRAFEKVLSV